MSARRGAQNGDTRTLFDMSKQDPFKPLEIVIDTREQTPWHFEPWQANVRLGTLRTGDYALFGDTGFAVERKSLDDFLGTVSTGWERFQREVYRAKDAAFPAFPVIVEGTLAQCCFHWAPENGGTLYGPQHNHPKLTPQFVNKRIAELTLMGCAVMFCDCPAYASAVALAVLKEREEALDGVK